MQQHYNLSDEIFQDLKESNVSTMDMLQAIPIFTPHGTTNKSLVDFDAAQVTKVSLMYYIDFKGDFTQSVEKPPAHQLIAKAVFKSLALEDQMEVLEYISFIDEEEIQNDN